ncbi:MAG TPA: hypothetical protein VK184_21485 [Nostocaceae cyanobacterium]|nr:hypothetical protein [Nostocaceae cyanobacterium]
MSESGCPGFKDLQDKNGNIITILKIYKMENKMIISLKKQVICRKFKLKEQKSDFDYWQTQSYQARLETLEKICQEYHQWKYNKIESRVERVYTITRFR